MTEQGPAQVSPENGTSEPQSRADVVQSDARVEARAQALQEHRRWLLGVDHETSASFDKVLTTLSAGALGIAVNLGRGKGIWLWSLELSWASFTASLLAMLFSYLTCRRELARSIKEIDWKLTHGEEETQPEQRRSWHEVTTYALNRAALVFLVMGICFLVAFAATNL